MATPFEQCIKLTIDKLAVACAAELGIAIGNVVDADDITNVESMLKSNEIALLFQWDGMNADPVPPLYSVRFSVGAKTVRDKNNFKMAELIGAVSKRLSVGSLVDVEDLTGSAPSKVGHMFVAESVVDGQDSDKEAGIRMVSVTARAAEHI